MRNTETAEAGGGVIAVSRALQVLEAFQFGEHQLSLAEISRRTGLHNTTVLRLARTLAMADYMVQDEGGLWRLGAAAGWLGARYQAGFDINNVVEPTLRALSQATQESASFYVREGNEQLAAGKAQEALDAFDRALAALPDDLSIHFNRGAALYALGKLPEAQREFQRAAESSDPTLRADALYNLGNAHLKQQQPKEAIDAYKRTLKLRPEDRRAKWNLELALRLLQQEQDKKNQQQNQPDQKQQQNDNKQDQSDNKQQQNDNKQQQGDNKQQQNDDKSDQNDPKQQPKPQDQKSDENKDKQDKPENPENKNQAPKPDDSQQKPPKPDKAGEQPKPDDKAQKPESQPKPQGGGADGQPENKPGEPQKAQGSMGRGSPRDVDRQDAEAVLDAFERVEPTVQKDLAKRKAKNVRPRKDW